MAARRVLVYVIHTGTCDITERIQALLTRHGGARRSPADTKMEPTSGTTNVHGRQNHRPCVTNLLWLLAESMVDPHWGGSCYLFAFGGTSCRPKVCIQRIIWSFSFMYPSYAFLLMNGPGSLSRWAAAKRTCAHCNRSALFCW